MAWQASERCEGSLTQHSPTCARVYVCVCVCMCVCTVCACVYGVCVCVRCVRVCVCVTYVWVVFVTWSVPCTLPSQQIPLICGTAFIAVDIG